MTREVYEAMPAELTIREFRVRVQDKTKRVRKLVVVTTLTDAADYPAKELGSLFRQRWHAELDLRTLKTDMRMEMLRTKRPEMVRKEIAVLKDRSAATADCSAGFNGNSACSRIRP